MTQFLLLLLLVPPVAPRMVPEPPVGPVRSVTGHTNARAIEGPRRSPASSTASIDPEPLTPAATRKAESLLRDHLPCLGCHTLNGNGGKVGPDLTSVRTRRSADYIAAIVANPARVIPAAAMPRTLMLPATRDLVIRYLQTRPGDARGGAPAADEATTPAATPAAPPDGATLYAKWCASCHGIKGKGDGPNAPSLPIKPAPHADKAIMSLRPDDSLFDTIASGGEVMNRSPRMPAFGASLSAAEIRALVAHIRTLCRCEGPAWSRDDTGGR